MKQDLPRWPPYVVVLTTLIALQVAFTLVVLLMIAVAKSRGLAIPEGNEGLKQAIEIAIGDEKKQLALSIAINAVMLSGIAIWATAAGLSPRIAGTHLVRRLRLYPPQLGSIVIAILGLLGLTTALDSMVELLGLRDFGTLAEMRDMLGGIAPSQQLLYAALLGIGPGVGEELMFRGYLLNRIAASQGTGVALAVSSICFGAFHIDPVHVPLAIAMGFYLGACLLRTGSLWVPITAHAANNALATVTTEWTLTELQAALLIPLGLIACGSALALLSRNPPPLAQRASVW